MDNINTLIHSNIFLVLGFLFVLFAYRQLAKKSSKLPFVPLGLFIFYLVLILARLPLAHFGLTKWSDKLWLAEIIVLYCAVARIFYFLIIDLWLTKYQRKAIPKITRDLFLIIIFAVIAIVLLHTKGKFNLASVLTTSAVLTMVIGLAAQETLGNIFSGIAIQTEKLYKIGEWIAFKEHVGEVLSITWKSTLIRTLENEVVYIPNNIIAKEIVKNYSRPQAKHVAVINIGIEYEASPNKVRQVMLDTLLKHPKVSKSPTPEVRLTSFDDFSINYQIRFWNDDFANEKKIKAEIMNSMWYALKRNNIIIPFPIRDLRIHHIENLNQLRTQEKLHEEIRLELRQVSILEPLADEDLDILAKRIEPQRFGDGEMVVQQGLPGESMYIVEHGSAKVVLNQHFDKPVAILNEGAFFGEMSLLTGEKRTATVVAQGDSSFLKINKDDFADIIHSHPAISDALAQALEKRQAELDKLRGETAQAAPTRAAQLASKIKTFFGIV
ncbi:MAG: mechanosensitive ion channel family protein [Pseudomonadota bacterium]